jgi:hypothetical protein
MVGSDRVEGTTMSLIRVTREDLPDGAGKLSQR